MSKECENGNCDFRTVGNEDIDKCPICGANLRFTRSGLFMEQIRVIKEMREEDRKNGRADKHIRYIRPRYMVWENVCGAFSSNGGEDFRAVLEETAKVADKDAVIPRPENGKWSYSGCIVGNGWSIAWRTHDAQYWGVPQRRKRICLVADFDGDTAGKILFDVQLRGEAEYAEAFKIVADIRAESRSEVQSVSEGVSRDTEQGKTERKGTSADVEGSVGETGDSAVDATHALSFQERAGKPGGGKGILIQEEKTGSLSTLCNQSVCCDGAEGINGDVAGTLDASYYKGCGERQGVEREVVCCLNDQGGEVMGVSEEVTGALRAQEHGHQPVVYGISAYDSNSMKSSNPHSGIYEADTSRTLDLNGGSPACNQGGMAVVQCGKAVESHAQDARYNVGDVNQPLSANMEHDPANGGLVLQNNDVICIDQGAGKSGANVSVEQTPTLSTTHGGEPVICIEGNGSRESHRGDGYSESETMYTLNTVEQHAVCIGNGQVDQLKESEKVGALNCMHDQQAILTYGLDRASFNQGVNAQYDFSVDEELAAPLVARGPGGAAVFSRE